MKDKPIRVQPISFEELKKFFDKRIFAIPKIQRDFVWTKKKIVNLLDSIKKHYPIGSFLICEIPSRKHKNIREGTALPSFDPINDTCYLVIDGQQRLSVLYNLIYGNRIKTNRYQIPLDFNSICLSQRQNKESEFEFYDTEKRNYIKLHDILKEKANYFNHSKLKERRIRDCISAFESYSFPFIFIDGFDKEMMEEAFIRLNTGGTTLDTVDKLFTKAYHKDTDLRAHINNLMAHGLKDGFQYIDKIHIVKSIAANIGQRDFVGSNLNSFAKKISNPREKYHDDYKKKRMEIERSIQRAADLLTGKFTNASYIPYPAMLSILSIFFFENDNYSASDKQIKEIERWFWVTGFAQRYSGSKQRDNLINDSEEMKKLARSEDYELDLEGKQRLIEVSVKHLLKVKYTNRGTLRNTFFCYLISKQPREFYNGELINIKDDVSSIFNSKNDHHIFPKDILKYDFHSDKINILGNICFLKFGENIKIKNKPPWVYLKEYKSNDNFEKVLASHVIPNDKCVLTEGDINEKYEKFLEKREEMIKKDLTKYMGRKYIEDLE
ncbi:MAG: DUF262 domain-containing protein [Euryarchaeota archaeon]|nr:DUF262 domain-containing protein [Euryarchaeota archaeon]MCG2736396.1 DUF262 domain-containing protein [Candidatus Methanoperedenaceae archaeon]